MTDTPRLSLRHKIAQLIFPRIGSNLPPVRTVTEDGERIRAMLADVPLGGLCLFNGVWPETGDTLRELQRQVDIPLLIAADLERGAGQQIRGLTVFPHAMAVAHTEHPESSVAECGRFTAEQARAAGVHCVLGPVADVQSDPRNPIIATRALATDPQTASLLVAASIRGLHASGAIAVAKHFPGHGSTHEDSHESLPQVNSSRQELNDRDLPPFAAAIAAGVQIIMTAHVSYPALDASGVPATISHPILTDLLRHEMGFEGVVMTDSLLMAGIRDLFYNELSMAIAVLQAGADVLLDIADPVAVVDGLVAAVDAGRIDEARIDESFERLWRVKSSLLDQPDTHGANQRSSLDAAQALSARVAMSAIHEFGHQSCRGVTAGHGRLGLLVVKPFHARWDPPEQPIVAALRRHNPELMAWEFGPDTNDVEKILSEAGTCDALILALIVKPSAWHHFGLLSEQTAAVHRLADAMSVTLVSLGVPTILDEFPSVPRRCCTFSDVAVSQEAVACYLDDSPV